MLITDADLCPSENVYDNFYFKDGIFHFFCSLFFKVIQTYYSSEIVVGLVLAQQMLVLISKFSSQEKFVLKLIQL